MFTQLLLQFVVWQLAGDSDEPHSCSERWFLPFEKKGNHGEDTAEVHPHPTEIPQVTSPAFMAILIMMSLCRSRLGAKNANKKFLEAMLLIADTREAWEIAHGRIEIYWKLLYEVHSEWG